MNLVLLLLLGAMWGSSYLFIKVTVADVPPFTLVAGRLTMAAVILWAILLATRQPVARSRSAWAAFAVMGLFSGTIPYVLITWGEQTIDSGLAALLQATMPIFTVVMAHFVTADERIRPKRILGIIAGFAGVLVLMLPDLRQGMQANVLGQLAVVVSSVSYAGATIFARRRLRGTSPLMATTGQITTGALFTLPLSLLIERPFGLSPSTEALLSWLGLVLIGTVVAYVIYYALLARTSATFTSTVTYIIPVNGLILGALVLDEPLTLIILASAALILAGVLLVSK
ncbi:MAG TPA: EamA family transporter [Anaerolineae bacterium]|nr:EamA family transporter [Anaerolineae bacterium]